MTICHSSNYVIENQTIPIRLFKNNLGLKNGIKLLKVIFY